MKTEYQPHNLKIVKQFTGHKLLLLLILLIGPQACSRFPDITSAAIQRVSSTRFDFIDWSPVTKTIFAVGTWPHGTAISDLHLVEVNSGNMEELSDLSTWYEFPRWSPDGRKVALTVRGDEIWLYDLATDLFTYLTNGEGAVWFPDGTKLAIYVGSSSNPGTGHREIRIVDQQGQILRTIRIGALIPEILQPVPNMLHPSEHLFGFDLSPDGEHLIVTLELFLGRPSNKPGEYRSETYLVNLGNESVVPFLIGEPVSMVSWAPDGTKIAYIRHKGSRSGELVIVDNNGVCQLIPDLPPNIKSPTWSKGGQHIAFLYRGEIHILDINLYLELEDSGCP